MFSWETFSCNTVLSNCKEGCFYWCIKNTKLSYWFQLIVTKSGLSALPDNPVDFRFWSQSPSSKISVPNLLDKCETGNHINFVMFKSIYLPDRSLNLQILDLKFFLVQKLHTGTSQATISRLKMAGDWLASCTGVLRHNKKVCERIFHGA